MDYSPYKILGRLPYHIIFFFKQNGHWPYAKKLLFLTEPLIKLYLDIHNPGPVHKIYKNIDKNVFSWEKKKLYFGWVKCVLPII